MNKQSKANTDSKSNETTPPKNFLKLVESNKAKETKQLATEDKHLIDRLENLKSKNKRNLNLKLFKTIIR